jgi:predicted secreted protein with PEFG-CTERM motif
MDYKAYALMAILLASVASVALAGVAYAQTTITLKTDKPSYATGEEVTVTGKLTATTINQPILIQVFDPDGNFVRGDQFDASSADGSFTYKFKTGGPLMAKDGNYKIKVTYKGTTTEETTFQFDAGDVWKKFNIRVGDKTYPVEYKITGGSVTNMVPDEDLFSLTVTVTSTADGNLQIRLPRNVIDARAGTDGRSGADEDFVVFADEVPSDVSNETETTVDRRTLSIDFEQGTETIEIVGTWAIPEFGAIAAIILAIAIVGIIVATARYGKFNFAPRL